MTDRMKMRSHLTAFGVGAGLSLLAAGAFAVIAPNFLEAGEDGDGVHVVNIGNGDNGAFRLKDDDLNISADWKGDFSFAADGRSLTALKGSLEVASKSKGSLRKAAFSKKDGEIVVRFTVDDKPVDAGEEQAAGDLLQLFARSSGVNASDRVAAMMAAGGKDAVIDEIGALVGSHAVGAYVEALAGTASLTDAEMGALADRLKTLESDYAKRTAVAALLAKQSPGDRAIEKIIEVAKSIEGDHELRLIIDELAGEEISARNLSVAATLINAMEGDHEMRLAIDALLESEGLAATDAARVLEIAAASIEGDYELRLALDAAGGRIKDAAVGAAALSAIGAIEGGNDRRLAVESFASALDGASPHWLPLIDAASGIEGDHDRRLALEAIAGDAPETDEIRTALRRAAQAIASDHERRLALESVD